MTRGLRLTAITSASFDVGPRSRRLQVVGVLHVGRIGGRDGLQRRRIGAIAVGALDVIVAAVVRSRVRPVVASGSCRRAIRRERSLVAIVAIAMAAGGRYRAGSRRCRRPATWRHDLSSRPVAAALVASRARSSRSIVAVRPSRPSSSPSSSLCFVRNLWRAERRAFEAAAGRVDVVRRRVADRSTPGCRRAALISDLVASVDEALLADVDRDAVDLDARSSRRGPARSACGDGPRC